MILLLSLLAILALAATVTGNLTHSVVQNYQDGYTSLAGTLSATGDKCLLLDVNIAQGASNQEIDIGFTIAEMTSCDFLATAIMTVTPYNAAVAGTAIALTANTGKAWQTGGSLGSNPITGTAVTKFLVTSSAGGRLQARVLLATAT